MLSYFEKEYDYETLMRQVGDFSQLAGMKQYTLSSGKSKGVEAVDVRTGSGLGYTVLLDKGLNIAWAEYKGIPFGYMTQTGVVAPQYYEPESNEWLRSFEGGLLTTCGLSNIGPAGEWNGIRYGQHGRISNIPGEKIHIGEELEGGDYVLSIAGQVRQVKAFAEHMILHRTIRSYAGKNKIIIHDTVENRHLAAQPLMLLYHINFGFPLFNENSGLHMPGSSAEHLKGYDDFKINENYDGSLMYYFDAAADENGFASAILTNDLHHPEMAAKVSYRTEGLDTLGLWKNLKPGNRVLCIEPANSRIIGIEAAGKAGALPFIKPGEKRSFEVVLEILEGYEKITDSISKIKQ